MPRLGHTAFCALLLVALSAAKVDAAGQWRKTHLAAKGAKLHALMRLLAATYSQNMIPS